MPQQNETSLIIPASLSFPDAGIMPKDPKTKVKVRQVKKFSALKIIQITTLLLIDVHYTSSLFSLKLHKRFYN